LRAFGFHLLAEIDRSFRIIEGLPIGGIGIMAGLNKSLKDRSSNCMRLKGDAVCKKLGFGWLLVRRKRAQGHDENDAICLVSPLKRRQFSLITEKITIHRRAFDRAIQIRTAFCMGGRTATKCGEEQEVLYAHRQTTGLKDAM